MDGHERVVAVAHWGALLCAMLLAARGGASGAVAPAAMLLIAVAATRTFAGRAATSTVVLALVDAVPAVAVGFTGGWSSPLLPCVIPPVLAAALLGGARRGAIVAVFTVAVTSRFSAGPQTIAWALELVLLVVVGAHARRVAGVDERITELRNANRLLVELHAIARGVYVTSDVEDVVCSTAAKVRELLGAGAVSVRIDDAAPFTLGTAAPDGWPTAVDGASTEAPLVDATGTRLGEIRVTRAVELTKTEAAVLADAAAYAGLAIDNARRLQSIRTLAVGEERRRIARDLHDQFGQELASLGYLLDSASMSPPPEAARAVAAARAGVAGVVTQLRGAIADLRAEPDPERGLPIALQAFLDRVAQRSGLVTRLDADIARLPVTVERELLHIAQEAVVNVERHARAAHVEVRLTADGDAALLEVVDDGAGIDDCDRPGHFGLVGMHERARSVGADLHVVSDPGRGTTVTCKVAL